MLAELHRVPRWERPFWVFEQLEVALFEGIWERVLWAGAGRVYDRWHLESGVKRNREHPETFEIPDQEAKQAIEPGVFVKLMFDTSDLWGRRNWSERMWVEVVAIRKRRIVGVLRNDPHGIPRLAFGDQVRFKRDHVIDILWKAKDTGDRPHAAGESDSHLIEPVHAGCNSTFKPSVEAPETAPPSQE
jgi:uncharacterized protein YegJ (DUF2314 family)